MHVHFRLRERRNRSIDKKKNKLRVGIGFDAGKFIPYAVCTCS